MEETEILKTIGGINHALDFIANVKFRKLDLTKGKYQYLNRIAEYPGITQTELGELLRSEKSTVSRAVSKLIKDRLVIAEYSENNSKSRHLKLTEKGQSYAEIIERENQYSTEMALHGLSNEEIKQLNDLLNKVDENIKLSWMKVRDGFKREY